MNAPNDTAPVIIGVGEIADRGDDPLAALEPIALMEAAVREAEANAGGGWLERADSLDVIYLASWAYPDAPKQLSERLGIQPRRAYYSEVGGEIPVRLLHEAAQRIAAGQSEVAIIASAEAAHAVARAMKAGKRLPWSAPDLSVRPVRGSDISPALAVAHGVCEPVAIYPLYENATTADWGLTPAEAARESATLYAAFSAVAAAQPNAWLREARSAEAIATPSANNRYIAWPYTKAMVANPMVNQGAAVILTSAGRARAAGLSEAQLVHVWSGAGAKEPRDFLARDQYLRSDAQDLVLGTLAELAARRDAPLRFTELYSCFPCVPKMARRSLGLPETAVPTVTGGLSFFGGPLSSYMTHAMVAMVRALRAEPGSVGLVYGQGEFVTKHEALLLASRPAEGMALVPAPTLQAEVDARRGPVPSLALDYSGPATLETYTVLYHRDGHPQFGCVLARTPDGRRLMAHVEAADSTSLQALTDLQRSPIGSQGMVSAGGPLLRWVSA